VSEEGGVRDLLAEFEAAYASTPPWDIGAPQPAFAALAADGRLRGRVFDVGCGTGEHVLMAAEAGLETTGIDISPTAIRLAEAKARKRQIRARFVVGDALALGSLGEQFDTVLDCGLFHVFGDDDRMRFVESLRSAMTAGGRYFMLCFSDEEPPGWGPRRVTQQEIRESFSDGWQAEGIEPAALHVTVRPEPVKSWFSSIVRS